MILFYFFNIMISLYSILLYSKCIISTRVSRVWIVFYSYYINYEKIQNLYTFIIFKLHISYIFTVDFKWNCTVAKSGSLNDTYILRMTAINEAPHACIAILYRPQTTLILFHTPWCIYLLCTVSLSNGDTFKIDKSTVSK